jgi:fatty acid desaturase
MFHLCPPAMLYLILGILGIIAMLTQQFRAMTLILKIVFILIWTWFLNLLCSAGYSAVSWFLVILPFVLFIVLLFFMKDVFHQLMESRQHDKEHYSKRHLS